MKKDKLYHVIAGFLIGLIFGLIKPVAGIILAVGAGAAKELIWDGAMKKGTLDGLDFLATALGGIFGTATAILAINYIF